jgi:predicted porin
VAQAEGHSVEVYGRINNTLRVQSQDLAAGGSNDDTGVHDVSSRIGVKASAPINDGLEAFGRYEFSTTTDSEGNGIEDTRIAEVGVRGDIGTIKIGNMWSTYYNIVGTHLDPTVTLGAVLYSTGTELPYRVSNAIQYSNDFGGVTISAELRVSDEDAPDANAEKIGNSDGHAIGASFMLGDSLLLAAVFDSSSDDPGYGGEDVDRTGLAAKWTADNWWASVSWGETDSDGNADPIAQTQLHAGMSFGGGFSGLVGYGMIDANTSDDPTAITLNLTKRFGKSGFRLYYEGIMMSDGDDVYGYDEDTHILGARIDF